MRPHYLLLLLILPTLIYGQETIKKSKKLNPTNCTENYFVLKSDKSTKHGSYQKMNDKGTILVNGFFKNGTKDSIWNEFNGDGKLIKSGFYREDKMVGLWNFYDYKGVLELSYDFSLSKLSYFKLDDSEINKKYIIRTSEGLNKVIPERPPLYLDGSVSIRNIINSTLRYPILAQENGVAGTVEITFTIDTNGKTSNYRITKSIGSGCDEEALRVVKQIPDNWLPGIFEGKAVTVEYTIPVNYKLQ